MSATPTPATIAPVAKAIAVRSGARAPLPAVARFPFFSAAAASAVAVAALAGCSRASNAPQPPGPMGSTIIALAADLGAAPIQIAEAWQKLDALATTIRARHAHSGAPWIDDVNATVFDELGFEREVQSADVRFFRFPDVIAERRGTCLGLGALYLVLAERLGFGLDGVMVPGHFFVRTREEPSRNIELLRRGESMPADWYRRKYGPWPEHDPLAFRPLTTSGVAAAFWFNAGNVRRAARDLEGAARAYANAVAELPHFAEAEAGLGAVRQLQGALDEAEAAYSAAARGRPDLPGLAQNLALLERERERERLTGERAALDSQPAAERRARDAADQRRQPR